MWQERSDNMFEQEDPNPNSSLDDPSPREVESDAGLSELGSDQGTASEDVEHVLTNRDDIAITIRKELR